MLRRLFLPLAGLAAVVLLFTCAPPTSTPPVAANYLMGVVYDSVTGEPLQGVVIRFGERSTQTGIDGSYSIALGESGGTLPADWLIFKEGYEFIYVDRVSIDSSSNRRIPIRKTDLSGYPTVSSLQGDLSFADDSPIPDGTVFWIGIYGRDGTYGDYMGKTSGSRYSINTRADSNDCLVILRVNPAVGNDFVAMAQGVDLSSPSPVELDFKEPADGFAVVQVTASQGGNGGACVFSTPYGMIPGLFKDEGGDPEIREGWQFSSASEAVLVYNPFNWQKVFWVQNEVDAAFKDLPDHSKQFMSSTGLMAFSETVSLPSVDRSLGPDEGADPTSLEINGAALSLKPVAGAILYSFSFKEEADGGNTLGTVLSFDSSFMLPDLIIAALGGRSIRVGFGVMDSDLTALDLDLLEASGGFPPDLDIGMVVGSGTAGYERLIEVPEPGGIIIGIE